MALAGVNMMIFHLTTNKTVHVWEKDGAVPLVGRTAAIVSIVLWIAIIFCGRWIGFTIS